MALRFDIKDQEQTNRRLNGISIGINNICRSLGAKGVKKIKEEPTRLKYPKEKNPTIEEALMQFGGKGVVIEKGKRNG